MSCRWEKMKRHTLCKPWILWMSVHMENYTLKKKWGIFIEYMGNIYRIQNMKNQRTNVYKILYAHVLHSVTNIKYDEMNRCKTFSQNVIKISDNRRYVYYKN